MGVGEAKGELKSMGCSLTCHRRNPLCIARVATGGGDAYGG